INQLEERGIRPLRLASREHVVRPGVELVVIGHPGLRGIDDPVAMTYTKGQVAGPEREINGLRYYQLQVPAAPGNSGGPVLDMTGQVIAIVTMGVRDNNQGQFNFALHLKYLYELLDDVP
ncbi:MAG: serine protease, partial [Gemmatales bacterium]|nr:serine protease [Gemmatales bacterium]MDW8175380.1 serine protease [Gemmatales bacterium]